MEKKIKTKLSETEDIAQKPITISDEPNRFVIQKADKEEIYEINKNKNFEIISRMKDTSLERIKGQSNLSYEAFGLLGVFSSNSTQYLVVISEAAFVGEILKSKIYQITKVSNF